MPRARGTLALIVVALAAGCGGGDDGGGDAAEQVRPEAVERSVVKILEVCIDASFDPSVDTGPVTSEVNRLIRWYRTDPDVNLAGTDLKQKTMEGVLSNAGQTLRDCSPSDADRINNALTQPLGSEGQARQGTTEPDEVSNETIAATVRFCNAKRLGNALVTEGTVERIIKIAKAFERDHAAVDGGEVEKLVGCTGDPAAERALGQALGQEPWEPLPEGVPQAASDLARTCLGELDLPVGALVDRLLEEWEFSDKGPVERDFLEVAAGNLRDGCGPEHAARVERVLNR
jgi:hypothetical protein